MTDDMTTITDPFLDQDSPAPYAGGDPFDMDTMYEKAEAPTGGGGGDLPDGKYIGYVWLAQQHTINKGENAGRPMVKVSMRVMDGTLRGHTQDKAYFLTDERGFGFLKGDLAALGVDIAALGMTFSQFVFGGLENLRLRVVEFQVQRKPGKTKEYVNVYINRLVNGRAIDADLEALDAEGKRAPEGAMAAAAGDDFGAFSLG